TVQKGRDSASKQELLVFMKMKYPLTDSDKSIFLNRDLSQIVFVESETTFISINGGKKQTISPTETDSFIVPRGAVANLSSHKYIGYYGFEDFGGKVFATWENVFRLTADYQRETVAKNAGSVTMTDDGKDLFYLEGWDGKLCTASAVNEEVGAKTVAEGVMSYAVTSGGFVCYVNSDYELHRIEPVKSGENSDESENQQQESIRIATEANWVKSVGSGVFFDSELSQTDDGGMTVHYNDESSTVVSKVAEDVLDFVTLKNSAFYYKSLDGETYTAFRSPGNSLFAEIASDTYLNGTPPPKPCKDCGELFCPGRCQPCEYCGETFCYYECELCKDCDNYHQPWLPCPEFNW
ncbi:MAG: hypothetical protein FWF82_06740, partial [Oscillospiraceae bacterium]|nr:hypothetical protein [Oscillospiraceae bacterium]